MPLVTVLATGGTIATRADDRGVSTAQDSGADLLARLGSRAAVEVRVRDVLRVGSDLMTLDQVQRGGEGVYYEPKMSEDERATLLDGWHRAVERAREWATE